MAFDFHTVGVTAGLGAAGGLLIGPIFPPAFLAPGLVGARWVSEVEKAIANADNVAKHQVDKDSPQAAKKAAGGAA